MEGFNITRWKTYFYEFTIYDQQNKQTQDEIIEDLDIQFCGFMPKYNIITNNCQD